MSDIRRKLLTQLDTGWIELARFNTVETGVSHTVNLRGCHTLGFFIVGGGGSGHGDFDYCGWSGFGGNGGEVKFLEVPYSNSNIFIITVGSGGNIANPQQNSNDGNFSSIEYNNQVYKAIGGYGGSNTEDTKTPDLLNCKKGGGVQYLRGIASSKATLIRDWSITHTVSETTTIEGLNVSYGSKGEDGAINPFDSTDENLYGAGGGGGLNAYEIQYESNIASPGGTRGGGNGGYGSNNSLYNSGTNASFYGAGGGGGSFSSNHTYGYGGSGYQGIIIIYGK